MSSPYPKDIETMNDKQIYAMEQAGIWLSRIDDKNTEIDTESILNQLKSDKKEYKNNYYSDHLQTCIDDYIFNHPDLIQELFNTDSIDRKVEILSEANKKIMSRFGTYYKPEKLSYDELMEQIETFVEKKNDSDIGPDFDIN